MAAVYSVPRNSLSGNFVAKSSAAFSSAAASVCATAALYASNSGCVLAAGGRFPAGAAGCPAACPAGGFCAAGLLLPCPKLKAHIPSTATIIAARFMLSPQPQTFLISNRPRTLQPCILSQQRRFTD